MLRTRFSGRVWVVGHSVNTDAMYPAHAMKMSIPEAARHVFYELRPGWVDDVERGDIIVAGRNFGLGSSRPVAALLRELGISALVAEEFNSLFFRNAINHGLPALRVGGVSTAFADGETMTLDLSEGWVANDDRGTRLPGDRLPDLVLEILSAGGIMEKLAMDGYLPETHRRS
ncbi:3-isopropylmalate dehydratase [Amycolatopsis jejuensis]|uniref:LeuD/DmdB family oxidoreductase small subunit n=1 Tax=Amycolatopsis jejuensis TaxID=330084 RepID=UPI0005251A52|nr:3-isopropylmalate dehydratase [Amycolatopsis jejuensis]